MVKLTIRDLIDLVASGVPNPESRLEKVYEWAHTRRLELVKWILASAAALFAPVVVAFAKGELSANRWLALALFASVAMAVAGLLMLIIPRRRHKAYLAAQALLGEIQKIAPFLERYRQELESK